MVSQIVASHNLEYQAHVVSNPEFLREGSALQFALAPVPIDTIPADSMVDKAVYDLWHWKDTRIQPQQRVDAARDRNRTWAAIFQPSSRTWVRVGNDSLTQVTVADNGRVALALNPVQYAVEATWGDGGSEIQSRPTTGQRENHALDGNLNPIW